MGVQYASPLLSNTQIQSNNEYIHWFPFCQIVYNVRYFQGPSSVANDIFCTVLLQKDPIVPIDGPHFRNLLRAHDEGGGMVVGGLTLKSRTVLTIRVGLPVSPLLQPYYECREVGGCTAQQLREWMCSAEIASDHVSPSVLGKASLFTTISSTGRFQFYAYYLSTGFL